MALGQEHHAPCCPEPSLISLCFGQLIRICQRAQNKKKNDPGELRWCLSRRSGSERRVANATGVFWRQTRLLDGTSEFSLVVSLLGGAYNDRERWNEKGIKVCICVLACVIWVQTSRGQRWCRLHCQLTNLHNMILHCHVFFDKLFNKDLSWILTTTLYYPSCIN